MSIASSTQKESYGSGRPPAQQRADRQDYKGPFLKPNVIPMNVRKFSDEKFWIEYERRIVEGDETKFGHASTCALKSWSWGADAGIAETNHFIPPFHK